MFVGSGKKLIDALVETGKIHQENVADFANLSNQELEQKLKAQGIASEEDINRAYGVIYSFPYISLKGVSIPSETLSIIPENFARQYKIIAYQKTADTLKMAVTEPGRLSANLGQVIEQIKRKKNLNIELAIVSIEDFNTALAQYDSKGQEANRPAGLDVQAQVPSDGGQQTNQPLNLDKIQIPYEVITKFPEDIARKYKMVVFEAPHPSFIKVAVANPDDQKVREILSFIRSKNDIAIEEFQVSAEQIQRALGFYKKPQITKESPSMESLNQPPPPPPAATVPENVPEVLPKKFTPRPIPQYVSAPAEARDATNDEIPEILAVRKAAPVAEVGQESDLDEFLGHQEIKEVGDVLTIAETGNVPKTLAAIIALAVVKKASDIHIESSEKFLRVRFRIDGILRDIIKLPLSEQPAIISRIKILSNLKIDESRIPQDGRFDVKTGNHQIDLRVSTLPTIHGEKAAMRILDKTLKMYTLEDLGLVGRNLKLLQENIDKPYGIVLSTGPTGSGKTTTLYAILNRISTASVNIVTLEDPVEYELAGLNQCQIRPKIGFTFANGLRSVLRQDPNVIMVGEIRDSETASLATHAALTGHLVLSTLHTNDATGALPRLINMGVEPFLITSSINCIIGQRLVRRLCDKCKRPAHIPVPVLKEIETELAKFNFSKPYNFFEGRGCPECDQGYKGRVGIFEVLPMTEKIETLAIARKPASEIKNEAIAEGMVTMKQDGLIKAMKGITTVNEVLRVVTI